MFLLFVMVFDKDKIVLKCKLNLVFFFFNKMLMQKFLKINSFDVCFGFKSSFSFYFFNIKGFTLSSSSKIYLPPWLYHGFKELAHAEK